MAQTQKRGLGRGFDALLPDNFDNSLLLGEEERVQKISVEVIKPNPHQPRMTFDEKALMELADSIKHYGVLQPLILTPSGDHDGYYLVAGERRWRAAKIAGLKHVPAIARSSKELEQLEIALVENVQRVDLSPLEQASSIQRLRDQFNMGYETIAQRLGKATTTIINIARLLGLPAKAQTALNNKVITEGHARAILSLKDAVRQNELLELITKHGWSVRQAEQFVTAHKQGYKTSQTARQRVSATTPQTEKLGKILKTTVTLKRMANGGRLEITYKNEADLERIIGQLSQE